METTSWHSYPSIFAMGHSALKDLLTVPVNVEEKIDGSQFSFGVFGAERDLKVRSKGVVMNVDAPEAMFGKAVATAKALSPELCPEWTYRCEFLSKPKHNTLAYERTPVNHLILFDVNTGHEEYLSYEEKAAEARRLGVEVVPRLYQGTPSLEEFAGFLKTPSILGGQTVEGVVVKPTAYNLYASDKKVLMGKYVSEVFKEAHALAWKETSPKQGDILERLIAAYAVQGRWMKAVQHLTERGEITDSPKDIGALFKEVAVDIEKECMDEIKTKLWEWAWPHIRRGSTHGMPEWYKEQLLKKQFERE
jgi:hypothetical protein